MGGRQPRLLMDIHTISEVNKPNTDLSKIQGPAHSDDFKKNEKYIGGKLGSE
jgi:NADH-quinone oxidoreductase subunit G